jgi:hypothetical protein
MILLWLCRAINDFIEKAPLRRFGYFGKKIFDHKGAKLSRNIQIKHVSKKLGFFNHFLYWKINHNRLYISLLGEQQYCRQAKRKNDLLSLTIINSQFTIDNLLRNISFAQKIIVNPPDGGWSIVNHARGRCARRIVNENISLNFLAWRRWGQ